MDDATGHGHLLEEASRFRFRQLFALDNEVEKLTPRGVFHEKENLRRCFDDLRKSPREPGSGLRLEGGVAKERTYLVESNDVWVHE